MPIAGPLLRTRRWFGFLIGFSLLAAACSSADDVEAIDAGADTSTTLDTFDETAIPPATAGSAPAVNDFDYSTVDYDADPVASALFSGPDHPDFPPPLVDPGFIVSGGPPPDGIPPIDSPIFVSIDEAGSFLENDNEAVVVVDIDGDARAYPIQVLIWHEIVNDEVGGVPVTVTYCPLCNSAIAFDRRLGDRVLDFGTSGRLYQSALVMYDRQTESMWAHFTGQGIVGHYAGAELDLVAAQTLSFGQFKESHPDGIVLSPNTGFERPYGSNPYVGYDDEGTQPITSFISQPIDERLASKNRVVGIVDPAGPVAITLSRLADEGVVRIDQDGRDVVVFHQGGLASALEAGGVAEGRDIGQTGAFVPVGPDGSELTFSVSGDGFVDAETGTVWTVTGEATEGSLAGHRLEAVPLVDTFWFAWATYRPGTLLLE